MMKQLALTVLLLLSGCGGFIDPCTDILTDEQADLFVSALEVGKGLEGLTKWEAQVQVGLACFPDIECQECFEWLIEKVYD